MQNLRLGSPASQTEKQKRLALPKEEPMPRGVRNLPLRSKTHQRGEILRLLREAKASGQGVNKAVLVFQCRHTQAAVRIFELEKQGYVIEHRSIPGERFVTFFLVSEPKQEGALPKYQPRGADPRQGCLLR
jgi:hypothetical protein